MKNCLIGLSMMIFSVVSILITILVFGGEDPYQKLFRFDSVSFTVDEFGVRMLPRYGKVYGQIETIEVQWSAIRFDSVGKIILETHSENISAKDDLVGAYYKAKNLFMAKQENLLQMFEKSYLMERVKVKRYMQEKK